MSEPAKVPGRKPARTRMLAALASFACAISLAQAAATADPAHAASIGSQLGAGSTLAAGSSIQSPGGAYQFDMQTDGNLVEYGPSGPLWATYTNSPGGYLVNQGDGNLVVYSASGVAIWASGTNGQGLATLVIQDDGNVVDYKGSSAIWSTYTAGGPPSSRSAARSRSRRGNSVSRIAWGEQARLPTTAQV